MTVPHSDGGHAVCLCGGGDPDAKVALPDGSGGDAIDGAVRLVVPLRKGESGSVSVNDLCWSSHGARHAMAAHADGKVRLWDLRGRSYVDMSTGEEVSPDSAGMGAGGVSADGLSVSAKCVSQADAGGSVVRCSFLARFDDAIAGDEAGKAGGGGYLTAPFVTGSDRNSVVTIWSGFPADGSAPAKVRTFELKTPHPLSLAIADAGGGSLGVPQSTFVLLADNAKGNLHALHLRSRVSAGPDGKNSNVVSGFDYLSSFRTTHPVYSWTVVTSPAVAEEGGGGASREGDVDVGLFCVQSRAVQMLTLTPGMRAPPAKAWAEGTALPEGVTAVVTPSPLEEDLLVAAVTDDEFEEFEDYDEEQEEEEEEEGNGGGQPALGGGSRGPPASSLPPPRLSPDLKPKAVSALASKMASSTEANPFANWLGAIAAGTTSTAASSPPPGIPAPPPGVGFDRSNNQPTPAPPPTPVTPFKPSVAKVGPPPWPRAALPAGQ